MRAIVLGLGATIATPDEGIRSSPALPSGSTSTPSTSPAPIPSAPDRSNGHASGGWITLLILIAAAKRRRRG